MTTITVAERVAGEDGSFEVTVGFGGSGEHLARVVDPSEDEAGAEALLAWYFEEHLRFPFLDKDLEARAVEQLAEYGRRLFAVVFEADRDCWYEYQRLRDRGFDGCRLEVVGSTTFQRLHWEALRDPAMNQPLALRVPVVRRVGQVGRGFDIPDRATLNILMVTARPDGARDVGYRTISRPLLDAVRQARLPVTVDLVRPGTWAALRAHMTATKEAHGTGWYHVVHFDVHGAVADPARFATLPGGIRHYFLPDDHPSDGAEAAFLFFETAEDGVAQPVAADAVAGLLDEHRVPIAVLNACQSAKQAGGSETSLAQGLVAAGVPVAVGMAYSVTVSAAEMMMPVLYKRLVAGADLVDAAQSARRQLFDSPGRRAYFDQSLDLEDWMLPVVFWQRPVQAGVRSLTAAEATAFDEREARVPDEPQPTYGFVGRDLDIQSIERRLLGSGEGAAGNELLVRGMAGAGKTTLLEHLGWWWQRTGLVERAFRFSYEDRAWTLAAILHHIGEELLDPAERGRVEALSDEARLGHIARLLRAERYLLVIDNAESITASPASIPHALDEPERERLHRFLARLRDGKTLVMVGSRIAEDWLAPGTFAGNVYDLGGLDPQAVSQLVDRVLAQHGGMQHLDDATEREALDELVELLGGYPLPLTVILPALATTPPSQVLADLRQGNESPDPAGAIRTAVEYSHGRLDPATQSSLLLLAPFTSVIPTAALADYQQLLGQSAAVQALGPIDLGDALDRAIAAGLATPHPQLRGLVRVQPVLPYFLRVRIAQRPDLVAATDDAHRDIYTHLGREIWQLLTSRTTDERSFGAGLARAEYGNLTAALGHALETDTSVRWLVRPIEEHLDQRQLHRARRRLLERTIASIRQPREPSQLAELADLHNLAGSTAIAERRYADARTQYLSELRIRERLSDRRQIAIAYNNLGAVAQEQRRFDEAEGYFRQALAIKQETDDALSVARTLNNLGAVAQERGRFEEAEGHLHEVLATFLEFGDRHSAGRTLSQLGLVAQARDRVEEAEDHYRRALAIYLEFDDLHSVGRTLYQLGLVAQARDRVEEAEDHYRRTLTIFLELDDRHGIAGVYHQLGVIAQERGRLEEAEGHYRSALAIYLEFDDRPNAATVHHNLGAASLEQERFEEAEEHYRQALATKLDLGDRRGAARTHQGLAGVANRRGRFEEAEEHERQALAIFTEVEDLVQAAHAHHNLGVVIQEQERFDEAEGHYRQALATYVAFDDRGNAGSTYSQLGILLTGRGRIREAVECSVGALVNRLYALQAWSALDLSWLKRQRRLLGADEFDALVEAHVSVEFAGRLSDQLDRFDEPGEGGPGRER